MKRQFAKSYFMLIGIAVVLAFGMCAVGIFVYAKSTQDPVNADVQTKQTGVAIPYSNGRIDIPAIQESLREARKIKEDIVLPQINSIAVSDASNLAYTGNVTFNSCYSPSFVDSNKTLYQIVAYYFSSQTFGDTAWASYIDPLYVMAISNVEYGGLTSPDILLAPALPTNRGVKPTKENLLNFGYSDYLKNYASLLRSDRKAFRGPMQMFATNMTGPIKPNEIRGSEYTRLLAADQSLEAVKEEEAELEYVEGSGVSSTVDGTTINNYHGVYGDRFNYPDCVNRFAGYIKTQWSTFSKQSDINKGVIDSKYAWMAMSAIGHNASPGIYYVGDTKTLDPDIYYWWPYKSFGAAREYCHYLGTTEAVKYIKSLADDAVKAARSGGGLKFRLGRTESYNIAVALAERGTIPKGLWKCTIWNHEEKIGYPICVLYNYFVLNDIYHGQ